MTENLQPGLGIGALREAVAFVIETEGGDLYDRGHVIFSDARQAQDRADDLNSELENESFRVAPLYRALSLSNPIEAQGQPHCPKCNTGLPDLEYRREGMAANWAQAAPEIREALCGKLIISKHCLLRAGHENGCKWSSELERALAPSRQGAGGK